MCECMDGSGDVIRGITNVIITSKLLDTSIKFVARKEGHCNEMFVREVTATGFSQAMETSKN
jgi:hypothetical protein